MVEEKQEQKEEEKKEQNLTMVEQANLAAERLEAANNRTAELINQREQQEARNRLGGLSQGAVQKEEPKEEDPREYAKKALRGEIGEKPKDD